MAMNFHYGGMIRTLSTAAFALVTLISVSLSHYGTASASDSYQYQPTVYVIDLLSYDHVVLPSFAADHVVHDQVSKPVRQSTPEHAMKPSSFKQRSSIARAGGYHLLL